MIKVRIEMVLDGVTYVETHSEEVDLSTISEESFKTSADATANRLANRLWRRCKLHVVP